LAFFIFGRPKKDAMKKNTQIIIDPHNRCSRPVGSIDYLRKWPDERGKYFHRFPLWEIGYHL